LLAWNRIAEDPTLSGNDLPETFDATLEWPGAALDLDQEALFEGVTWRRIAAYLIDFAIIGVIFLGLWFIVMMTFGLLSGIVFPLMPLVPITYHSLMIAGRRSATLGMQFMGIEVRNLSGGLPALLQAFTMTALFYLTAAATSMLILIVALFNDRRRCVHDLLSGTLVINSDPDH